MSSAPATSQPWPLRRTSELLDRLEHEMRRAAKRPDADAIHDIRVAIRRLRQCLDLFGPLAGTRASKRLHKNLRKLLKAAGRLRDLDIAIDLLKKTRLPRTGSLVGAIREDRPKYEADFAQALAKVHDGDVLGKWRAKLTVVSPPLALTGDHQSILPAMASEFFEAGLRAADASASPDTLHAFRIKAKKFRYTLELFAPVYGATLDSRLRVLRNVQQRLGDINDYAASGRFVENYRDGHGAIVDRALASLAAMAATETKNFGRYFHRALGPKQEELWIRDLSEATPRG